MRTVKVLKFGGTSVGSADAMRRSIAIVKKSQKDAKVAAVVVSAMSGVTNKLINVAQLAAAHDKSYRTILARLEKQHHETVRNLISARNRKAANRHVTELFHYLCDVVEGVSFVQELSPGALDYIMSYGERLSAHMFASALNDHGMPAEYLNARKIITTDATFGEAAVDFKTTDRAIRKYFAAHPKLQVVTGFIGATPEGKTTTLGRGGSDYSASIVGAALRASVVEIWTDVSGVYTADPRKVKEALPVPEMTYHEAMEMSYFGAKVIHPPTMRPAMEKNIPLVIKNTFAPQAPGTVIRNHRRVSVETKNGVAKGISSVSGIAMVLLEGTGLLRSRGASGRLFAALARARVNVLLITQASSQNSISFAIYERDIERARAAINEEFATERSAHVVEDARITRDLSVIALVGERMRHTQGVAGKLFTTLGASGVNIIAIAQGSSELNISVVVAKSDEARALQGIHTSFFCPHIRPVHVFLVGTGLIGGTLLKQIAAKRETLVRERGIALTISGIQNKERMVVDHSGINPSTWKTALSRSRRRADIHAFINEMKESDVAGKVFVDCTASEYVAARYADILKLHIPIVTPNKKANSGPLAYYQELKELSQKNGVPFLYETNVGAALPIVGMLDDMIVSGDKVLKIEGILSGTLSYIFNQVASDVPLSEAVREAQRLGYTEPDPRDDLKGIDMARKLLILARKAGFSLELGDITVESLVSKRARAARSIEAFFKILKSEDAAFEKKKRAALAKGKRIRYVAVLEKGKARVALRAFERRHPFYELSGSDNIILITTQRYSKTPLLIQGPGAGGEVTAAGVFADILRVARGFA